MPKSLKCEHPQCGKVMSNYSALKRHRLVHNPARPFTCDFTGCAFRTRQQTNLTRHLRTHTGEKPLVCGMDGCDMRFLDPSMRTKHKKKVHNYKPRQNSSTVKQESELDEPTILQDLEDAAPAVPQSLGLVAPSDYLNHLVPPALALPTPFSISPTDSNLSTPSPVTHNPSHFGSFDGLVSMQQYLLARQLLANHQQMNPFPPTFSSFPSAFDQQMAAGPSNYGFPVGQAQDNFAMGAMGQSNGGFFAGRALDGFAIGQANDNLPLGQTLEGSAIGRAYEGLPAIGQVQDGFSMAQTNVAFYPGQADLGFPAIGLADSSILGGQEFDGFALEQTNHNLALTPALDHFAMQSFDSAPKPDNALDYPSVDAENGYNLPIFNFDLCAGPSDRQSQPALQADEWPEPEPMTTPASGMVALFKEIGGQASSSGAIKTLLADDDLRKAYLSLL